MTVPARVFRRRVFYIPGYDPFHPRRYRELYRKEGAEQARISGYELSLRPRAGAGAYGWTVTTEIGGARTEAEIEVLVWSDLVRKSMSNSIPATYLQLVRTAAVYIGLGVLFRMARLRKGPMIAALYPAIFLLLQLAVALLLGWGIGWLVARYSHWALGLAVAAGVVILCLRWFRARDNKVFAWYLMHDYSYSARSLGANPPELEARMAEFRARIRAALSEDVDEVLVIGHSSGVHLGVSIMADLLREGLPEARRAEVNFLSLGQAVPMVSFLPRAGRLRRDLHDLCTRPEIFWLDVTAPGDGCCFALCDPVSVSGAAPESGKLWPLVISAAFTRTLSPQKWAQVKRRFFRLHFQYLCAFDNLNGQEDEYDYFRLTAGPMTLRQRYGARRPSASRIEDVTSRYTSLS